ncbi:MAG: Eco57I restriction-modification methylase domain-containing protein [Patescibacteria group bacterium]
MQKLQSQNIVKETLEYPFDEKRFRHFVRNLLNHIEEEDKHPYSGQFIPAAFQTYISTLKRIGKYSDGEHEIDILVVQLKKKITLERARVAQRNFIARYLNGSRGGKMKDAALVAFVSPNEADWRFSLIKMDYKFVEGKNGKTKVKEEFTPARRWSFLVGPNEHSHTAQAKLTPIIEDEEVVTLARLEEAFNIEKVTKEFFEKYRDLFLRTKDALDELIEKDEKLRNDFEEKFVDTADFSKKLLGQIVFLYFLQKKGWFGVPRDQKWGEGDKKFLRSLFVKAIEERKNYFNDYLEPLFYNALANGERDDDFYERFDCKIPFLNGGLFDPINRYDWVNTVINFPDELFSNQAKDLKTGDIGNGILDIFDRYNFTVKEDEPLEKEVAVDPEMLGKVFENLLEVKDRKSKGTYYTPREIVHYMCEQSLVNYLATELEGTVAKEDLEKLIKIGENVVEHEAVSVTKEDNPEYGGDYKRLLPDTIKDFANEIDDKLATIKVCDPAIGSGAFPVGMMNAIVKARMVLSSYLKDKNRTLYAFKRDCIQNSLYGVDIDPGAVEIAKLRLWLSLVVDEDKIKQIKPLPNLDYKIMQGNSLLEEFEGIKLFDEKLIAVIDTGKEKQLDSLKQKQAVLQKEYFELHSQNKLTPVKQTELNAELKKLQTQLKKLNNAGLPAEASAKAGLFDMYSEAKKKADDLKRLHKEFFEATQKSKKDSIKKQIEQLEWDFIETTLKEQGKTSALKKLEEFKRSNTKPFFLWKLNFADVFEEKGGFDVVIANPPYVRVDEIDDSFKIPYKKLFSTAVGKYDLYYLFFEKSFYLLNSDGFCIFISPNKFCAADSAFSLRRMMLENMCVEEILSTSKLKVFDTASNYPVISSLGKYMQEKKSFAVRQVTEFSLLDEKNVPNSYMTTSEELGRLPNLVIPINKNQVAFDLLKRLYEPGLLLSEVLSISEGLRIQEKYESTEKQELEIVKQYQFSKYSGIKKGSYISQKSLEKVVSTGTDRYSKIIAKKILIMEDGLEINATVDYQKMVPQGGVYFGVLTKQDIDIEFVLGVLNSRLLSFIYEIMYAGMHMGGGWLRYRSKFLENLPVNKSVLAPEKKMVSSVVKLVDQILSVSSSADYQENPAKQAKVRDLEHQIDEQVYKLYGLTEDEIKIVEAN